MTGDQPPVPTAHVERLSEVVVVVPPWFDNSTKVVERVLERLQEFQ